jgi:TM2 domain-containing membrane protein YozV
MSETPYNAGGSDPTQRYDPASPTSGQPSADPSAPSYNTPQWTIPPTSGPGGYPPQEPTPPAPPAPPAAPTMPAPTSGSGQGYQAYPQSGPPAGYPQPAYQPQPQQYGQPAVYGQQQAYGQPAYAAAQPQYDQYGRPLSDKSKLVAGLLGILLGGFGAGRFYTGHTSLAVGQLLVSIFTCGLGALWGLIDGIMILVNGGTDAQGRILRD